MAELRANMELGNWQLAARPKHLDRTLVSQSLHNYRFTADLRSSGTRTTERHGCNIHELILQSPRDSSPAQDSPSVEDLRPTHLGLFSCSRTTRLKVDHPRKHVTKHSEPHERALSKSRIRKKKAGLVENPSCRLRPVHQAPTGMLWERLVGIQ